MNSCQIITDMLPEYINKSTTKRQNSEIVHHISECQTCRVNFALWISVEYSLKQSVENVPSNVFQAMFDKLPDKETELERIINGGSYTMAFDIIHYAFSTVKTTFRLASLL